jgi:hypothetical protein
MSFFFRPLPNFDAILAKEIPSALILVIFSSFSVRLKRTPVAYIPVLPHPPPFLRVYDRAHVTYVPGLPPPPPFLR